MFLFYYLYFITKNKLIQAMALTIYIFKLFNVYYPLMNNKRSHE